MRGVNAGQTTPLRRSPRFHHQKDTSEPQQPKTPVPKSRSKVVCSLNPTCRPTKNTSSRTKPPKKSTKSNRMSRNCVDGLDTFRKSCRWNNEGNGFSCLRRSPRFSNKKCVVDEHINCTQGTKRLSNSIKLLVNGENLASQSRKSARVNDCVQSVKRSQRYLKKPKFVEVVCVESDLDISVELVAAHNLASGSRKSTRVNDCVQSVKRSHRILKKPKFGEAECVESDPNISVEQVATHNLAAGSRKSARVNDCVQSVKRPQRVLKKPEFVEAECVESDPNISVEQVATHNLAVGSRKSARVNDCVQSVKRPQRVLKKPEFVEAECVESDLNISVEQVAAHNAKVEQNSSEKSLEKGYKMTGDISANHEVLGIECIERKGRYEARNKTGVKRKRKRGEDDEDAMKAWTKEQELALQRAYFSANPTPRFWKKVSKLVPGKSAQECFDRIHQDHMTPPQPRPRSRAKIMNSSPFQQFSLSASKLLRPFDKVRRSNSAGLKNYLTEKCRKMLLKCHRKVDEQAHEGDLFSVLELDMDFPDNACHPSEVLSTPKQLKEKQGLLRSAETSSSSHKKSRSRFSTDIISPPVLKQVRNRVLHEKYVNQLRCREARRRAATAKIEKCKTGKIFGEESSIQKRDVVKAAKNALVSEARDAINKFQHSQANFIDNSDEDEDYAIGVESKDEEAEDEIE